MNVHQLLNHFASHNVSLQTDGEKLRFKAPKGFLEPQLAAALKAQKSELISLLQQQAQAEKSTGVPLSASQRHLWYLHQLEPDSPFYNNPIALKVSGALNVETLHRAANAVVARHDMLRAQFGLCDGVPQQTFAEHSELPLEVLDVSQLSDEEQSLALNDHVQKEASKPFNLEDGPLVRSSYVKLSESEYVWLVNLHHIAADGWSIGLFFNEVTAHYNALRQGTTPDVPTLKMQYEDYVVHSQQSPSREQEQTQYWTEKLAGLPALLDLPTDNPRPAEQTHNGAHFELVFGDDLSDRVRSFCKSRSITPFALFLAGFAVVLWRYSKQEDICIGTSFANRHTAEVEPLIGHFINTLALKTQVSAHGTFAELVSQAQTIILEALDNQDLPFEKVVEAVNPERSPAHSPLFQVMLIYQNLPAGSTHMDGVEIEALATDSQTAKFDITLEVFERGPSFSLGFEYNKDLFTQARIERMARHLECLLSNAIDDPHGQIDQIEYITPEERHLLTQIWPHGETHALSSTCIHEAFEAQCQRSPDAPALVCGEAVWSYAKLNAKVNQLARHLQECSVKAGNPVGLLLERSTELVITTLATLKAGGHFIPLEPGLPLKRLEYMVQDSQPNLIVTHPATADVMAGLATTCDVNSLSLDKELLEEITQSYDNTNLPASSRNADELAYIIYTSGTTGVPKGTRLTHRGLVNLVDWSNRTFPTKPGDALLQKTPMGFDAAIWEFFWPLCSGSSLVLAPPSAHSSPAGLVQLCVSHNIAAVQFVPAMLDLFLDEPLVPQCTHLRDVFCGGGELNGALMRKFADKLPWATLHNVYGPTECTVDTTWHSILPEDHNKWAAPVGRPISNAKTYLLDENMSVVPVGLVGELYIGGSGLASGYLNAPQQNASAFVESPFAPEETLYRTGDLAFYDEQGQLIFAGRKDNQIKLNGFRIELSEIEEVLLEHADCRSCTAIQVQREGGDAQLALCYTSSTGEPLLENDLRQHLSSKLPDYMLPHTLLHMDAIPLTNNGKIDYRAVEVAVMAHEAVFKVNQESPRDHIELQIYNIWREVLLHPSIGISDNFFHVGGSSIAAIKVAHRVGEAFKVQVPPKTFILNPTIEALASWIRAGAPKENAQDNLITFRESQNGEHVVCVHPAGGTAFCYLSLAKILADDIGVYGLQSPGLNSGEDTLSSIPTMAEAYLKQIEHIAQGKIVLTGLSFGGYVAFEMARLLKARGNDNVSVILLDTQGFEEHERDSLAPVDLDEFRDKLVKFNGMYPGIDDAQIERYHRVYNHNRSCVPSYECQPLEVRVVFVQALGSLNKDFLHELRQFWIERVTGSFMTRLVRGDHWELLESEEIQRVKKAISYEFQLFERKNSHTLSPAVPSVA
ncbi:amino acid adenylation domain-containing protein [Pseudovibrio denitrificans]|uniref:Amino acid adenylation domain-containing protein n=1 Tax=Pseudovibrio denitrificans TaxID=258256 RepID=A0A1I7D1C9_9HYPH|nr:non-ribosomal peptide synthetase [Pseudovibrio denitrificans]SFU05520.1 amino acid adenylation domain-containing protein [Pseudovibrio denitrificans]